MKIKMKTTVCADFPFNILCPGMVLKEGMTYEAKQNKYGAVSGLCKNGEWLGVKPGEFEIVSEEKFT